MLILDKRKAVEHMVALTAQQPATEEDGPTQAVHGRRRQTIATFERRAQVAAGATARRRADAPHAAARPAGGVSMA